VKKLLILVLLCSPAYGIEPDKKKHAIAGAVIGSMFTLAAKDKVHGMVAGCGAGALKETLDSMGLGDADWKDFLWTCGTSIAVSYGTEKVFIRNGRITMEWAF